MANFDTSMYGQIRPFQMDDPLTRAAKGLQVQAAQQQVQEGQRKFQLEDDLSSALSEAGGDYTKASSLLTQRGRGTAALQLADKASAQRKAKVDEELKLMEAAGSDAVALDSVWRQALQATGGNAQMAMAQIDPVYQQVRSKWARLGHQLPDQFDPQGNMASIGQAKEVAAYLTKLLPEQPKKPSSVQEYEYAKGQGYRGTFQEFQVEQKKAGATNVTLNAGTEKKYGEALAGKIAEADVTMRDVALRAPELAERANSVLQVLSSGKVMTGTGADIRLALGKALNIAGGSDEEVVANTEALASELASTTLDSIKGSGLGSGQGFTDKDREFLEKAKAGRISLEASTLRRLATLNYRAAQKSAERWNKRVKDIPDSALEGTGLKRDPIVVPTLSNATPKPASDPRVVVVGDKTYNFPTPAAAKRFRQEAGLKDE